MYVLTDDRNCLGFEDLRLDFEEGVSDQCLSLKPKAESVKCACSPLARRPGASVSWKVLLKMHFLRSHPRFPEFITLEAQTSNLASVISLRYFGSC